MITSRVGIFLTKTSADKSYWPPTKLEDSIELAEIKMLKRGKAHLKHLWELGGAKQGFFHHPFGPWGRWRWRPLRRSPLGRPGRHPGVLKTCWIKRRTLSRISCGREGVTQESASNWIYICKRTESHVQQRKRDVRKKVWPKLEGGREGIQRERAWQRKKYISVRLKKEN